MVGYCFLPVLAWCHAASTIAHIGAAPAASAWLGAAVAKYVPGLVWHPISAVERLKRYGSTIRAAALVFLVDIAAWVAGAFVVGALAAVRFVGTQRSTAAWLFLGLVAIAPLHPRVFAFGVRILARIARRDMLTVDLRWIFVGRVVALHAAGWVVTGFALVFLCVSLDAPAPAGLCIASAALSWAVGFLVVVAPAGVGVREATLVALLATAIPIQAALGAAPLWRMMFVAVDILSAGASRLLPIAEGD